MKRHWFLPAGGVLAASVAAGHGVRDCAGELELEKVHIARVEHSNDVLVLRDGRAIHMEGIRIPHANQDRAPAFVADQAYDTIVAMAKGRAVSVTAIIPKEDR